MPWAITSPDFYYLPWAITCLSLRVLFSISSPDIYYFPWAITCLSLRVFLPYPLLVLFDLWGWFLPLFLFPLLGLFLFPILLLCLQTSLSMACCQLFTDLSADGSPCRNLRLPKSEDLMVPIILYPTARRPLFQRHEDRVSNSSEAVFHLSLFSNKIFCHWLLFLVPLWFTRLPWRYMY